MSGSDPHFPRISGANPHFLRIFKIPTFLVFSKSSLSSLFQNPHFPHFFILTKVDTIDIGLLDFWPIMMPSNNHFQ